MSLTAVAAADGDTQNFYQLCLSLPTLLSRSARRLE